MRCEQVRPRLGAYADGRLEGEIRKGVEAHASTCGRCGAELASIRALGDLLGSLPAPPIPENLDSSILDAARRLRTSDRVRSRFGSAVLRVAAALLVALAGAYLGARVSRGPAAAHEIAQAYPEGSVESLYQESFAPLPSDSPGARALALFEEEGR